MTLKMPPRSLTSPMETDRSPSPEECTPRPPASPSGGTSAGTHAIYSQAHRVSHPGLRDTGAAENDPPSPRHAPVLPAIAHLSTEALRDAVARAASAFIHAEPGDIARSLAALERPECAAAFGHVAAWAALCGHVEKLEAVVDRASCALAEDDKQRLRELAVHQHKRVQEFSNKPKSEREQLLAAVVNGGRWNPPPVRKGSVTDFVALASTGLDYLRFFPLAASHGRGEIVTALVQAGAALECKDRIGQTPLLCAVKHGHGDIVEVLLQAGAQVRTHNAYRLSPLYIAVRNARNDIAERLLQHDAEPDLRHYTQLRILAEDMGNAALVETLEAHGAAGNDEAYEALFGVERTPGSNNLSRGDDDPAPPTGVAKNYHSFWAGGEIPVGDLSNIAKFVKRHPGHNVIHYTDGRESLRAALDKLTPHEVARKKEQDKKLSRAELFDKYSARTADLKKRLNMLHAAEANGLSRLEGRVVSAGKAVPASGIQSIDDLFSDHAYWKAQGLSAHILRAAAHLELAGIYMNGTAASDIIRLATLLRHGGTYLDTGDRYGRTPLPEDLSAPRGARIALKPREPWHDEFEGNDVENNNVLTAEEGSELCRRALQKIQAYYSDPEVLQNLEMQVQAAEHGEMPFSLVEGLKDELGQIETWDYKSARQFVREDFPGNEGLLKYREGVFGGKRMPAEALTAVDPSVVSDYSARKLLTMGLTGPLMLLRALREQLPTAKERAPDLVDRRQVFDLKDAHAGGPWDAVPGEKKTRRELE